MKPHIIAIAARLSDPALRRRLGELASHERGAMVELIAHLAEFDRRKLYREQGYGSLFSYCTGELRLSEHATLNRIEGARSCRSFPVILDLLKEGAVNLSMLRLLAPHLTPENHARLLGEARGRSKREVEAIVARLAPRPDVPSSVRKLPTPNGPVPPRADGALAAGVSVEASAPTAAMRPFAANGADPIASTGVDPTSVQRPIVAPLAPERYRMQFTVDRETHETLRQLQDLLRREIPDGDPAVIVKRALALLLEDVARKKLAATANPRPSGGRDPRSRHVPAEVKRKVWIRDHGQCAFVSPGGRRCRERTFLEFHHVDAYALGGETTVDNVSLRCREHNVHEAEPLFGRWGSGMVREPRASYSIWSGGCAWRHNELCPTRPGASWRHPTPAPLTRTRPAAQNTSPPNP